MEKKHAFRKIAREVQGKEVASDSEESRPSHTSKLAGPFSVLYSTMQNNTSSLTCWQIRCLPRDLLYRLKYWLDEDSPFERPILALQISSNASDVDPTAQILPCSGKSVANVTVSREFPAEIAVYNSESAAAFIAVQ
jgi:hypothetical protein